MILVTGCARSGTSLTTGILAACGLNLGAVNTLHENLAVRDGLVKPLLRQYGFDPYCQGNLPTPDGIPLDTAWRGKVIEALGAREPRGYKGAKMCHFWPLWHAAFPEARWIIVRRDRERIVDSCIRTSFMRHHGDSRDGWGGWHDAHLPRFAEIMRACWAIEVWPDDEMAAPEPFRAAVEFAGLPYDAAAVRAVIRPSRWHR